MTHAPAPVQGACAPGQGWPLAQLDRELGAIVSGLVCEVVPSIGSTNSELMRRARDGAGPSLLVAERQTAGRGRLGRSWHSLDAAPVSGTAGGPAALGALTFSLGLALAPHEWSGLSLAVGVSLACSLHPDLGLKWPNDIWFEERKLAGILIETATVGEQRCAIIGVGINILPRDGAGLSTAPAWLGEAMPGIDAPRALLRVAPALVQAVKRFESSGFAAFRAEFERRDVLRGRAVCLSDGGSGTACGVDGHGALLVHTAAGMRSVSSAEVSVRPAAQAVR